MSDIVKNSIKAIIGLGNPGSAYYMQRHSIGFRVLDTLAQHYNAPAWHEQGKMAHTTIMIAGHKVLLVKPLTFMNASGAVMPWIRNKGVMPESCLIVHDELELPFGVLKWRIGGSHRGHNGVRSIIAQGGEHAARLRFGIDRPINKEEVPDYVLRPFTESKDQVNNALLYAVSMIESLYE